MWKVLLFGGLNTAQHVFTLPTGQSGTGRTIHLRPRAAKQFVWLLVTICHLFPQTDKDVNRVDCVHCRRKLNMKPIHVAPAERYD